MNLAWWLAIFGGAAVLIRLIDARRRAAHAASLSALARSARMNFSPIDRFDLERRLQHSPVWTAGLKVRDVLYGTRGEERLFVATLEQRASGDDETHAFVVACAEPLDHRELRLLTMPLRVRGGRAWLDAYRAALAMVTS